MAGAMRWFGNLLAIIGAFIGLWAAYLWWRAADLPAGESLDTMTADFAAIAAANKAAALWTGISALFIAVAEILRLFRMHRH
jgi:hypothetical protein